MAGQVADETPRDPARYLVVARRYRPQSFTDLVGQQSAARALSNAIATERIGHAYLFTGARGVGKTSTARIFAKALNCVQGPTAEPCQVCDMCQGVAEGHDVDVLEIDGASNRGIDEIRQLRSSVGVRPSRARYKIYIIDEVHMLTREAFNALLKTLEEPPPHVKFIFCTTSPEKIPITVLSRCQRFDFPPVELDQIVGRLASIVESEGATAEPEALEILARRAAGSMRDSQSLLEQVLAFSGSSVTAARVHEMLGTASSQRVLEMLEHLVNRQGAAVLQALDAALHEGVDAGQFAEQLLGHLRDTLALAVGAPPELLLHCSQAEAPRLTALSQRWGVESLLAAAQIIDQGIVRMRQSLHGRTLLELALVRVSRLEELDALPEILHRLTTGTGLPSGGAVGPSLSDKKKSDAPVAIARQVSASPREVPAREVRREDHVERVADDEPGVPEASWDLATARSVWQQTLDALPGITGEFARRFESVTAQPPNRLVVIFPARYNANKAYCERPERRLELEAALRNVSGRAIKLEFQLSAESSAPTLATPAARPSARQVARDIASHKMVKHAIDLFGAEITGVDLPRDSSP